MLLSPRRYGVKPSSTYYGLNKFVVVERVYRVDRRNSRRSFVLPGMPTNKSMNRLYVSTTACA